MYTPPSQSEDEHGRLHHMQIEYSAQLHELDQNAFFCILHESKLNALSNSLEGESVIGITVGAPLLLSDLFLGLLSHPAFVPDIGASTDECAPFDQYNLPTIGGRYGLASVRLPRFIPISQTRRGYAALLTDLALDFLFLHEMGHLVAGHIPYLQMLRGSHSAITAFDYPIAEPPDDALTDHAIEFDADWFAMKLLIPLCLRDEILLASFKGMGEASRFRFRSLILAIILCILVGGRDSPTVDECLSERQHPHPYWRILLLEYCGLQAIHHNLPGAEEIWTGAFRQALKDIATVRNLLTEAESFFAEILTVGPIINDHHSRLLDRHQRLIDQLKENDLDKRQSWIS